MGLKSENDSKITSLQEAHFVRTLNVQGYTNFIQSIKVKSKALRKTGFSFIGRKAYFTEKVVDSFPFLQN